MIELPLKCAHNGYYALAFPGCRAWIFCCNLKTCKIKPTEAINATVRDNSRYDSNASNMTKGVSISKQNRSA